MLPIAYWTRVPKRSFLLRQIPCNLPKPATSLSEGLTAAGYGAAAKRAMIGKRWISEPSSFATSLVQVPVELGFI